MERHKIYLVIAILATIASGAYWTAFGIHQYNTFQISGGDLGVWSYNTYFDIHNFAQVNGLQLLAYGNHLSLLPLVLIPIFYLWQSIFNLMLVQIAFLSLTAIAIYFIVKELTKEPIFGLAFCLAFLFSPGIYGIFLYGFHPEAFIILPFLLTFYYYIKLRKGMFVLSALLLLGVMEVTPFLGVALGIGLLAFDLFHTKDKRIRNQRLLMAAGLVVLSLGALAAYSYGTTSLIRAETTGRYINLPSILKLTPFNSQQTSGLSNVAASISSETSMLSLTNIEFLAYGLLVAFLGFGVAIFYCPEVAILLAGPWLAELFLIRNYNFIVMWFPYFFYVLGGTMVAAVLGIMLAKRRGKVSKKLVLGTLAVAVIAMNLMYPFFIVSASKASNISSFSQNFLFQNTPQQREAYATLEAQINQIPQNESVMTQFYILSHLINHNDIEMIPLNLSNPQFMPDNIIVDFNQSLVPAIEQPTANQEQSYLNSYTLD